MTTTGWPPFGPHADGSIGLHSPPIARTADPATSHQAAEAITKSGQRQSQCEQILAVIQCQPGAIAGEIADETENPKLLTHEVIKRIHDLEVKGLVIPGASRRWAGSGKMQRRWFPAECQGRLMEG